MKLLEIDIGTFETPCKARKKSLNVALGVDRRDIHSGFRSLFPDVWYRCMFSPWDYFRQNSSTVMALTLISTVIHCMDKQGGEGLT